MNTTEEDLRVSLHLTKYEAKLYLAGLNYKQATLSQLAKAAKIPRTAAYQPVKNLIERGLLTRMDIGKRAYYVSLAPEHLKLVIERDQTRLKAAVANLTQEINTPKDDVYVRYFSGLYGVSLASAIFTEETTSKLQRTFEQPKSVMSKVSEAQIEATIKKRVGLGIANRSIYPSDSVTPWLQKLIDRSDKELMEIVVVSQDVYPIQSSLAVTEGMVFIFDVSAVPFGILIKSEAVAQSFISMHNIIWDKYHDK